MANRVLLGQRDSDYGLWVSRPGQNVVTANADQLLFDMNTPLFQAVVSGVFTGSSGTVDITIANLGYSPMVIAGSRRFMVEVSYPNATTVRLHLSPKSWVESGGGNQVYYSIMNVPVA